MKLTIDTPVSVSVRPATQDRAASVTLNLLGGSLWFPALSCPSGLQPGMYKGAEIEVSLRMIRVENGVRSVFSPVRLLLVK